MSAARVRVGGQFIDRWGVVGDLQDTTVWRVGRYSGPSLASCVWSAPAGFSAPWFVRGALFEVVEQGVVTWDGVLGDPAADGSMWQLNAHGAGEGLDFSPVVEGDQIVTEADVAGRSAAVFFSDGDNTFAPPAGWSRTWVTRPGAVRFETDDEHYVSGVRVFYVSSVDGTTGEPDGWALTTPVDGGSYDSTLEGKFGAKRVTVDATALGLLTAGAAETLAADRFETGGGRLGWTGSAELSELNLRFVSGAVASGLSVRAGDVLRVPGLTDSRSGSVYASMVSVTLGEVTRLHGERRAVVKPFGAAARDLASIFATIPRPADAGGGGDAVSTSIQARVARSRLGYESFAHLTTVPVVRDGGITPDGLLFDGDLTDEEVGAVWWWVTSTSDADQAEREALYVRLGEAVAGIHAAGWQTDVIAELLRYQLGLQH